MRLDDFLKTVDSSTQLLIDLVTNEQEIPLIASGTKQEAIPSLISRDIYNLDMYDIYLVEIIWKQISKDSEKYPVLYILAKENRAWT